MRSGAAESDEQRREPNRRGVPSDSADSRPPDRIDAFMDACLARMIFPGLLVAVFLDVFGWIKPSVAFGGYFAAVLLALVAFAFWHATRNMRWPATAGSTLGLRAAARRKRCARRAARALRRGRPHALQARAARSTLSECPAAARRRWCLPPGVAFNAAQRAPRCCARSRFVSVKGVRQ